jgi:hypothetical protein
VGLEPTTSASTLLLQEEEVPFELELIGRKYKSILSKEEMLPLLPNPKVIFIAYYTAVYFINSEV